MAVIHAKPVQVEHETIRAAMIRVATSARAVGPPECYRWRAVWWNLHSKESADPVTCINYARNQLRLARDMEARPEHYDWRKRVRRVSLPNVTLLVLNETDWQRSGLEPAE